MNKKEISEIKRRFKFDYNAIGVIYGYYINSNKDIISSFDTSLGLMEQSETEIFLSVLKKTLSGTLGKNLIDIEFSTSDVENKEEHKMLMKLKDTCLRDEEARMQLVEKIIPSVSFGDDNYLILMAADAYDVPYRDGNLEDLADAGSEVFQYFICCVCPVKPAKLKLQYNNDDGEFHSTSTGQIAASPELGFMFPTFDDRSSNIYNALYYVHKPAEMYDEFIDTVFNAEPETPMSAPVQRAVFQDTIAESLEEECSFDTIKVMNNEIRNAIEIHKEEKNPEKLELSVDEVGSLLSRSGVAKEKIDNFKESYTEKFGESAMLTPDNIVETKKFKVETPEITINVAPENAFLLKTRIIDGSKYILVPAGEGVQINGIDVTIAED
ncbi:MAG: DUF4317 domain-containing protein [Firmicutes bacterium]|nr:DUF4317 domain-containing protein [Bacillota bacterium]